MATTIRTGDLVFSTGRQLSSDFINIFTGGIPRVHFSHVGVISHLHMEPLVYESVASGRPPCCRSGRIVSGVQAHPLGQLVAEDTSKIWHAALRSPLYFDEADRLAYFLDKQLGVPYDVRGAARAGGLVYRTLCALIHPENFASFFCSELAAGALIEVGAFRSPSASRYSPNRLYRALLRQGIIDRPRRLN